MESRPDALPVAATRVQSVDPADAGGLRARVTLEDGSVLEVATEVLERTGLGAGDPLDEADWARLQDDDLRWRAREAALVFLGRRAYSRDELRRRLRRKGFPKGIVELCLDGLASQRIVDDGAFAESFLRDRLRLRPRGRRRLSAELREKGLDAETAERAIADVFEQQGVSEEALARESAIAWLSRQPANVREALTRGDRSPECLRAARRLDGFLARRGFSGEVARAAARAATDTAASETTQH